MIHTLNTISPIIETLKKGGKTITLVTGFFDLIHPEHIRFLEKASGTSDILVLGIESDKRARELKGKGRPIFSQEERAHMLSALSFVDYVLKLPDEFSATEAHVKLLQTIKPDILAVSESSPYQDKKRELIESHGGRLVVVHSHNPEFSTTKVLEKIKKTTN